MVEALHRKIVPLLVLENFRRHGVLFGVRADNPEVVDLAPLDQCTSWEIFAGRLRSLEVVVFRKSLGEQRA